ncbi:hypothetical protein GCM10011490_21680 [Pseudoclavibacter endophyticus]|nr:hypothetical protein GCM10011490_21680 [Pseudoclavibacter endophyticus]
MRGLKVDLPIAALVVGMMVLTERYNVAIVSTADVPEESVAMYLSEPWTVWVIPAMFFAAFALRRVLPIVTVIIGVVAFLAGQVAPYGEHLFTQIACFVLIFSGAAWSPRRVLVSAVNLVILLVFLASGLMSVVAYLRLGEVTGEATALSFVFSLFANLLYVLAAAVLGSNEYRRAGNEDLLAVRTAELRERTEALEAERRVVAEQAVRLDRIEIARELHDVVAHHVSLMGLQAAAARRSLASAPERPERAVQALLAVEESARSAITELQLVLTTLRSPASEMSDRVAGAGAGGSGTSAAHGNAAAPAAGSSVAPSTLSVEEIPALIDSVRAAGMSVSYREIGDARPMSGVTGLTLYRILQEALTNAQKHAGPGADVDVRVRHLGREVELDVTNGPRAPGHRAPRGGGRGIVGMRERATAIGGTLEAGPRSAELGGGFRVVARLPLAA